MRSVGINDTQPLISRQTNTASYTQYIQAISPSGRQLLQSTTSLKKQMTYDDIRSLGRDNEQQRNLSVFASTYTMATEKCASSDSKSTVHFLIIPGRPKTQLPSLSTRHCPCHRSFPLPLNPSILRYYHHLFSSAGVSYDQGIGPFS